MPTCHSDGVLNPSGVRFGSSEIYSVLSQSFSREIVDALCVGQQRRGDSFERVLLFVKLAPGYHLHGLENDVRSKIAHLLSRRHVPQYVFAVDEIPYNINGKKLEIPVKAVVSRGQVAIDTAKVSISEKKALTQYLKYFEIERAAAAEKCSPGKVAKL